LTHTGSAASDISAGRTAQVRISLRAVSGNADVIGDFGDAPLFEKANQLVGTWSLELPGIDDERFEFTYTFEADGNFDELRLRGSSLTLGVPLAQEAAGQIEDDPAFAELSGIARAALAQLGSVIGQAIRNNSLDRVVLVRVR